MQDYHQEVKDKLESFRVVLVLATATHLTKHLMETNRLSLLTD